MIEASKDSTLITQSEGNLANGRGYLISGRTRDNVGPGVERALLAFDIAGQVPSGALITGVELELHVIQAGRSSDMDEYTLHKVQQDWGEGESEAFNGIGNIADTGDSTWIHTFYDTVLWNTPGGDFDPMPSATQIISGAGPVAWNSTAALIADVQAWLDDPTGNFGWILRGNEDVPASARSFESSESSAGFPVLTVTFDPATIPEPGSLALGLLGCMLSGSLNRRRR
jgi:hypothetical protein